MTRRIGHSLVAAPLILFFAGCATVPPKGGFDDVQTLGMKRRARLILSLAAFFGLSSPLCTFACLTQASETHTTASTHGSHGSHPFDEEHSNAPRDHLPSDHECDCDELAQALLAKGETPKPTPSFAWAVSVTPPHLAPPRIANLSFARPEEASLPPPDILLLKSTLLI